MNIRVVVVDDFPLMQQGVINALKRDPAIEIVGRADNGEEGLRVAEELKPDVLVLDLHLPKLGGMEVLKRLRETAPDIRTLILTASEKAESLLDAVAEGASGYLHKRASHEELRQAVITVYGRGSVVSPSLAGHLLREYSHGSQGGEGGFRGLLTGREEEILRFVAQGHTDKEIAAELRLSPRTVQNHLARIRNKTSTRRRSDLARWATDHAAV